MFSITTIASSTTKPDAIVSAIKERLSRLKPSIYIAPKVPTSDSGTDRLGMMVARALRRKTKITSTTSRTASASSISTSRTEARVVTVGAVRTPPSTAAGTRARAHPPHVDGGGQGLLQLRQQPINSIHHLDDVGARLALDVEHNRRDRVHTGRQILVLC